MMTLGSLFDGAGGFPLAGTMAGITPRWASEIEPFPIRVTTKRFPNMKHLGSITEINGGEIEPVDIVTFGSPCQDLSVAGRRQGLSGERSGLFLEAIRIIKEMREKTHGRKPRYIVWENVPGAFSSNAGRDFQAVLTEIIRIAEPNAPDVPLPDKRWPMADLYGGNGWSLAYRVYDAQYWGVPQRRKRIYLVADFGGNRAGKIQFECDRLCGDSPQGAGTREETPGTAGKHLEESGRAVCLNDQGGSRMEVSEGIAGTLRSEMHGHPPMVAFHLTQDPITDEGKSPCIGTGNPAGGQATVGVMLPAAYGLSSKASNAWNSPNPDSGCYPATVARTLNTNGGDATCNQGGNLIVARVFENHGQDTRFRDSGDIAQTVVAKYGTGGGNQPLVVQPAFAIGRDCFTASEETAHTLTAEDTQGFVAHPTIAIQGSMIGRRKENGPQGGGINENVCFTLNTSDQHAVCAPGQPYTIGNGQVHDLSLDDKARTLNCMHDAQAVMEPTGESGYPYIVRRLTPQECGRLQGYHDGWCEGLETPEPTEEEIDWWCEVFETHRKTMNPKKKPRSRKQVRKWLQNPQTDSAEYKMWGNSLAIPNAYHVLAGIAAELQAEQDRPLYIASWSGGKDSTASIILAHEHGDPLDVIIYSEVMFDSETSADPPEQSDFIRNKAIPIFESWGYKVKILHPSKTFIDCFFHVRGGRSKYAGKRVGFPMRGRCEIQKQKVEPIRKFYREINRPFVDCVGIAIDESERLERTKSKGQISLLEKYGYTEEMAYSLCEKYGLLSPVYKYTKRGGCWFCPNSKAKELRHLRDRYPNLWQKLLDLEDEPNLVGNIWDTASQVSIHGLEEQYQQEDAQISIFDYLDNINRRNS